jgi:hypothetical protein
MRMNWILDVQVLAFTSRQIEGVVRYRTSGGREALLSRALG